MDELTINKDFANKYNKYREKEELQKLKTRYGDADLDSESSDSESEDENAEALTPGLERDFFRTLAYLKKKDPVIYDESKKFYQDPENEEAVSDESNENITKSLKPMFLKDFERKVILDNEGKFLEDEEEDNEKRREFSPSYHEEQKQLQDDIKKAVRDVISDDVIDKQDGGLLVKREQSSDEKKQQEKEFMEWLKTSQAKESDNSNSELGMVKSEVAPLREYWTDPGLDEGEKFLRDYILDKKYLDPDAGEDAPTYDDIIGEESDESEEELFEKKSEIFEHKYNFRFEQPDQEFIKSYPRTIGTSVRRKEEKRKKKRQEQKQRNEEKKNKKQEELKQLKLLKKKEILNKIQKLQEATGNKDIEFNEKDLELDFDPETYDKRMQEIFQNYDEEVDEEKPIFSDIEEELEDYEKYWDEGEGYYQEDEQPDCEDPDFIMDCDYDPEEHERKKEVKRNSRNKSKVLGKEEKIKKKSAFKDSVAKSKPKFDPNEKSFEKYLEEYYALDYEDLIGDLPCRFKYRQVVPNDFGLSTDEILTASDRELNSWCSLKRAVQYRKEEDEIYDVRKYRKKAKDVWKKARVLKSVYAMPGEEDEKKEQGPVSETGKKKKMNSRKRKRMRERAERIKLLDEVTESDAKQVPDRNNNSSGMFEQGKNTKIQALNLGLSNTCNGEAATSTEQSEQNRVQKRKRKRNRDLSFRKVFKLSDDRLKAYGVEPKKFLKKMQYGS